MEPVEVKLRLTSGVLVLEMLGFVFVVGGLVLEARFAVLIGIVLWLNAAVAIAIGYWAMRKWRYRLRLDPSGIHLRKGPMRKLVPSELAWADVGTVVLMQWRAERVRADAVLFLPRRGIDVFDKELSGFVASVRAGDPESLRRLWVSHRTHRDDVARVTGYIEAVHPDIPIRRVDA